MLLGIDIPIVATINSALTFKQGASLRLNSLKGGRPGTAKVGNVAWTKRVYVL